MLSLSFLKVILVKVIVQGREKLEIVFYIVIVQEEKLRICFVDSDVGYEIESRVRQLGIKVEACVLRVSIGN